MKNKIMASIAFVLSIAALAMMSSDSTVSAQRSRTYVYDSGIVQLGPNQSLIGLLIPAIQDNQVPSIRSRKIQYSQGSCTGTLCRYSITSDAVSAPVSLAIGEGMSDVLALTGSSSAARIAFESNSPNLRANGQIIDTVSGAVVSTFEFSVGQAER